MTASEIEAELADGVVSGRIDQATQHLFLTTRAGAVIDAGGVGVAGAITPFVFVQDVASAVWTIHHNLGRYPQVTVVDSAGTEVFGDLQYIDNNTVQATFGGAFAGRAYLT
jgi:hypothetical protein